MVYFMGAGQVSNILQRKKAVNEMKKTVLITGCSSGFGRLAAKKFQKEGWNVVATMLSPEKETELNILENVHVIRLDVTDKQSIQNAVVEGIDKFGKIDVLVNNAGYGGHGLFEQFSDEAVRKMYETNVFGVMNVTREVLPSMRKQKDGCIINITSIGGKVSVPLVSIYSSTKFALEGLSEGIAYELKRFNIQVKTVAPGAYPTDFMAHRDDHLDAGDDELKEYATELSNHWHENVGRNMQQQGGNTADPQEVADKIFECATKETPTHNIVGADTEMLMQMKNSMPQQEFLNIISDMVLPKMD
jgi:NAD(P)-dependent dehydrogenase (short-subunit alcohol dehydrogenase family)